MTLKKFIFSHAETDTADVEQKIIPLYVVQIT